MRPTILTRFLIFAGILGLAIAVGQDLNAQTSEPQVATLLTADVAGMEGKDWNVLTVELAPGAVNAWHSYPGVELVYVLEGAGFLEVDGQPPVALNPGVVAALNPKQIHLLENTSPTQTLKVLVVLLLEKRASTSHVRQPKDAKAPERLGAGANGNGRQEKASEHKNLARPAYGF